VYPDIVAGVSIGAFNGAIIAAHPRQATAALCAFWNDLAIDVADVPDEGLRRLLASWEALLLGVPGFFRPRWGLPAWGTQLAAPWTSFYDPSPIRQRLAQYVDFASLKTSPVRLLVSAVNVETGALEVFDSYVDDLTPDHILASGSLPPGLPWTTIGGKHYWDGGILSNSPLEQVVERSGAAGKRFYVVDLFPSKKPLPTNLVEVMGRRDEIVYAERIRRDSTEQALLSDFRKLVEGILTRVDAVNAAQIRQWPPYVQLMGGDARMDITRIVRQGVEGEPASKDYDFSRASIAMHIEAGYATARLALLDKQQRSVRPTASGNIAQVRIAGPP
jgi:NTE family protein